MKEKLAFVCQRYGLEVNGGAELLCRQLAEKMTLIYDVCVYTTCAIDYITWRNEYKPGKEEINGVTVYRFPVDKERNLASFNKLSVILDRNLVHSEVAEEKWIDAQGPLCPKLLKQLQMDYKNYKAVIFMTYLYYLTARGLPLGFENAFLIPTVHDEPPVYLSYYDRVFLSARGIIWNTSVERAFAEKRFPQIKDTPGIYAGVGMDLPNRILPDIPMHLNDAKYIVYAGRIDESKGCGRMFQYFIEYKKRHQCDPLKLVLLGKAVMPIPENQDIIHLGFVSDEMKLSVMKNSIALILFSEFESLSMVVLESMMMERPVLVNGRCAVLKEHCTRSNAGLYFENYYEFESELDYLRNNHSEYETMCRNGAQYVKDNYRWDDIVDKISRLIDEVTID